MANEQLHDIDVKKSMVVLSNAATLVGEIIMHSVGNDLSSSLNGSELRLDVIYSMAMMRIKNNLELKAN